MSNQPTEQIIINALVWSKLISHQLINHTNPKYVQEAYEKYSSLLEQNIGLSKYTLQQTPQQTLQQTSQQTTQQTSQQTPKIDCKDEVDVILDNSSNKVEVIKTTVF